MRIAIVGRGEWLIESTKEIMQYGEILLVITAKGDNHYRTSFDSYRELARRIGAKFIESPPSDAELHNLLINENIDIVCSANYPQTISTQNLRIPKYGWLNAHPAPLPKYRGNACPNWAIINNEESYEIVVHEMSDILDGGPVFSRYKFNLTSETYISNIYEIMIAQYPSLFSKAIDMKIQNIAGEEQNEELASYSYPRRKNDSRINWNQKTDNVLRLIRASSHPFFGAHAIAMGSEIHIFKAKEIESPKIYHAIPGQILFSSDKSFLVKTIDGLLEVTEWAPKFPMSRLTRLE